MNSRLRRDNVVFVLIALGFVAIIVRAFYVQVIKTDFLQQEADKRQSRTIEIPAYRGDIYDRNGHLLALSTPMASVWVDPKVVVDMEQRYLSMLRLLRLSNEQLNQYLTEQRHKRLSFIMQVSDQGIVDQLAELALPGVYVKYIDLQYQNGDRTIQVSRQMASIWMDTAILDRYRYSYAKLATLLETTPGTIEKKVRANEKRRFLYLKRSVVPKTAGQIDEMNLLGVYTQDEYKRYYPAGEISAHLVGFTNIDDRGIEGVELAYNEWLRGVAGKKQVVKDRAGQVVDFVKDIRPSEAGKPITLSIDQSIQYFTYRALKETMVKHQALSASAVVLDAKTGEVLSMVSLPGYNPNDSSQRTGEGVRNRVVSDLIEPGSTIKPLIVAKALDDGVIAEDMEINTHPGAMRIQGIRISDTSNHGNLSIGGILQKSSNVGTAKIALMLTPQTQRDFLFSLGFGKDTGLFLPGEQTGYIKPAMEWQPIDQASASYGYGFNTNVMALAQSYLLFSNGGKIMPLSIIKRHEQPEGEQLIRPEIAKTVLEMMETAVSRHGTAPKARIPGYRVAGKTGTVHKTKSIGGYEENTYLSLFAGVVPVSDPDMVMVVVVNEPSRGLYYGGLVAAPVFHDVMTEALRIRNIAPDQTVDGYGGKL